MRSKGIKSNYLPPTVSSTATWGHAGTTYRGDDGGGWTRKNVAARNAILWWTCGWNCIVAVHWKANLIVSLTQWIETQRWSGLNCWLVYCCSCCRWSAHNQGHDRLQLKRDKSGNFNLSLCIFYFFYNNIYCWKIVGGHFQPPSTSAAA